jgi:transposase
MSKIKIKVNADLSVIKSELRGDDKFYQGIRLHAVYQIACGKDAKYLQEVYSTSHKSICNWVHRYNAQGINGLKDRPRSGRPSRLNDSQMAELKRILQTIPSHYGYDSPTWTGPLLIDFIKQKYSIKYRQAQIYNILNKIR